MDEPHRHAGHAPAHTAKFWSLLVALIIIGAAAAAFIVWGIYALLQQTAKKTETTTQAAITKSTEIPRVTTEVVAKGYDHIWEVAFLPSKEMLFTERTTGKVHIIENGKTPRVVATIPDMYVIGEGGLLGLAVDAKFNENRYIYTCFNSKKAGTPDVRVARWKLAADLTSLTDRTDIITGIPSNTNGRHSGCRLQFGPDGYLWVGTGDTAQGDLSVQPKSLAGKILRVDRDGNAAPGNVGGGFDARIYSYGHRNVQGIAFFTNRDAISGISVEHGSNVDDEINLLQPGNFGWAPPAGEYNELNVPMTDKTRFPDAHGAIWSSGNPTIAPSGVAILTGAQWKAWEGDIMMAVLKDKFLMRLTLDDKYNVVSTQKLFEGSYGRLRSAVMGPDGSLYIATDNASNDQIKRTRTWPTPLRRTTPVN